mgnify:CR=1 FL=1
MSIVVIRAISPCDAVTYKKRINGHDIVIRREQYDDWNDLEINLQDDTQLPESGKTFDLVKEAESYSIIDISPDTHIQFDELSDIPDEVREQVDEEMEEDHFPSNWEIIEKQYLVDDYRHIED